MHRPHTLDGRTTATVTMLIAICESLSHGQSINVNLGQQFPSKFGARWSRTIYKSCVIHLNVR